MASTELTEQIIGGWYFTVDPWDDGFLRGTGVYLQVRWFIMAG